MYSCLEKPLSGCIVSTVALIFVKELTCPCSGWYGAEYRVLHKGLLGIIITVY